MPDHGDAEILQILGVSLGSTLESIALSRNAGAYCSSPSFRNQSVISIVIAGVTSNQVSTVWGVILRQVEGCSEGAIQRRPSTGHKVRFGTSRHFAALRNLVASVASWPGWLLSRPGRE
jgi:hypothetical protein